MITGCVRPGSNGAGNSTLSRSFGVKVTAHYEPKRAALRKIIAAEQLSPRRQAIYYTRSAPNAGTLRHNDAAARAHALQVVRDRVAERLEKHPSADGEGFAERAHSRPSGSRRRIQTRCSCASPPSVTHVKTQKEMSTTIGNFLDAASAAICGAWATWQTSATIAGHRDRWAGRHGWCRQRLAVDGFARQHIAVIEPDAGRLFERDRANARARRGCNTSRRWRCRACRFGRPSLRSRAVSPRRRKNIPFPLAALAQVIAPLAAAVLGKQMSASFSAAMTAMGKSPKGAHADEVFASVAYAFETCFTAWQTATLVTNVLGTGPAPMPFGPVVGGIGTMAAGGLV